MTSREPETTADFIRSAALLGQNGRTRANSTVRSGQDAVVKVTAGAWPGAAVSPVREKNREGGMEQCARDSPTT